MSDGFLFATDLHLRDRDHPELKHLPQHAVYALNCCVDKANQENVPLVLGGDTLDSPRPSPQVVGHLQAAVRKCLHGVWFIDGNHDLCRPSWLELLGARRLTPQGEEVGGIRVAGFSFDQLDWDQHGQADVVVVHADWDKVVRFEWDVPLVLCGHNHFYRNTHKHGAVLLNPGAPLVHRFGDSSFGRVVRVFPGRYELCELPHRKVWQWRVSSLGQLRAQVSQTAPEWDQLRHSEPVELLPAVVYVVAEADADAIAAELREFAALYPESLLRFVFRDAGTASNDVPLAQVEDAAIWRDVEDEVWVRASHAVGEDDLAHRVINALRASDYPQQMQRVLDEWLESA